MASMFLQFLIFVSSFYANSALKFNVLTRHTVHDIHRCHPAVRHSFILHAKRRTTLSKGRGTVGTEGEPKIDAAALIEPSVASPESAAQSLPPPILLTTEDDISRSSSAIKGRQLSQRIQDDISDFERMGSLREKKIEEPENKIAKGLKNVFAAVFIADFFVVIVFLIWFLAAAAMQKTNPFLLEKFQVPAFIYLSSSTSFD